MADITDKKRPQRPIYNYENDVPKTARGDTKRVVYDVEKHAGNFISNDGMNSAKQKMKSGVQHMGRQVQTHSSANITPHGLSGSAQPSKLAQPSVATPHNAQTQGNRRVEAPQQTYGMNARQVPQKINGQQRNSTQPTQVQNLQRQTSNANHNIISMQTNQRMPQKIYKGTNQLQKQNNGMNAGVSNTGEQSINKTEKKSNFANKRNEKISDNRQHTSNKKTKAIDYIDIKKNNEQKNDNKKNKQNFLAKKQKKRNRIILSDAKAQRKKRKIIMRTIVTITIFTGILLSFVLLFRVESFDVKNETSYSNEQIISSTNIKKGDNLFSFNEQETVLEMQKELPFLEDIDIKRSIPNKIVISATHATAAYTIEINDFWLILSEKLVILETQSEMPQGLVHISGAQIGQTYTEGTQLLFTDTLQQEILINLQSAVEKNEFYPINSIDVSDTLNIQFVYDSRIIVKIGNSNEIEEKLDFAHYILTSGDENTLAGAEQGILDVSSRDIDGRLEASWLAGAI